MSFFIALLIILLVWFFLIAPFVRLIRVSRQWRDAFSGAARQQRQSNRRREPRSQTPRAPKKKIDPSVGEYVEFTETTSTTSATESDGTRETTTVTESQITDVTWEDLPD